MLLQIITAYLRGVTSNCSRSTCCYK